MGSIPITRSSLAVAVTYFVRAALLAAFCCPPSIAADLSGYAVLTTDYVWRGVTQSDGHAAFQLGGDVAFDSGWYGGIWGSTVDIDQGMGLKRDTELNFYTGYSRDVGENWLLGAAVIAYRYPGQEGIFDYDYEELQLSSNFADRFWVEYAFSPDLYDSGYETHHIDVYTEWPLGSHLLLGAGAGYYDVSSLADGGYAHWQLGVTWPVKRFDIDLRYHDSSRWVPIVSAADRDGARLVLSIRLSF